MFLFRDCSCSLNLHRIHNAFFHPRESDPEPGQTWLISAWCMNRYKNGMSPDAFRRHMNFLIENYNSDAADAMYESYVEGEDVEVTEASGMHALSTFTKHSIITMRETERKTKKRILCGYTSAVHVRQHAKRIGSIYTNKELWGCL